eukprot:73965_1
MYRTHSISVRKASAEEPGSPAPFSNRLTAPTATYSLRRTASLESLSRAGSQESPVVFPATAFSELWPPNVYVQHREGQVLSKSMIVKSDHFVGVEKDYLDVSFSGAPNFRQIEDAPICGVGQSTIFGVRTVLNFLRCKDGNVKVAWINLREEPVVYLNNRPFVLRELSHPFRNIRTFRGIDKDRIFKIESRLRNDILNEAKENNLNLLVHDEKKMNVVRPVWESVYENSVQTSGQVYEVLAGEGYDVEYLRIPVTAESSFSVSEVEAIRQVFIKAPTNTVFVYNCHKGAGRSTMGTCIVTLMLMSSGRLRPPNRQNMHMHIPRSRKSGWQKRRGSIDKGKQFPKVDTLPRKGDYVVLLKLVRVLQHGPLAKEMVDDAIDMCGAVENLRDVIFKQRLKMETATSAEQRKAAVTRTAQLLSRYYLLVCFAAYLTDVGASAAYQTMKSTQLQSSESQNQLSFKAQLEAAASDFAPRLCKTFVTWMDDHPELGKMMHDLVHADKDPSILETAAIDVSGSLGEHESMVFARQGAVLGKGTILKVDFYRNENDNETVFLTGAPNFWRLEGISLAGVAQPSFRGMRNVFQTLMSASDSPGSQDGCQRLTWINLREEPVIYINERPYLLRDSKHPFTVMPEFNVCMPPANLEQVVIRLVGDVKKEIAVNGGLLLIHAETEEHTVLSRKRKFQPGDVKTMRQTFEALVAEGYNIDYLHIPMRPEISVEHISFDRLFEVLYMKGDDHSFVFNSSQGRFRSTVACIVATLMLLHQGVITFDLPTFAERRRGQDQDQLRTPRSRRSSSSLRAARLSEEKATPSVGALSDEVEEDEKKINGDGVDEEEVEEASQDKNFSNQETRAILGLIRILRTGKLVQAEVDAAIDLSAEVYHVKEQIYASRLLWETSRSDEEAQEHLAQAVKNLETYANLICFNAYLHEHTAQRTRESKEEGSVDTTTPTSSDFVPFSKWMNGRPEIKAWMDKCRKDPEDSLRLDISLTELSKHQKVFDIRSGNVLVARSILKSDFFLGCANKKMEQIMDGAFNFRCIPGFSICGTAMPTTQGIQNTASYLLSSKNNVGALSIHWMNLREEPVLYINQRPYVLRDLHSPYSNFIYTGISGKRVEAMEKQLKKDALNEAEAHGGRLLLHDEDDNGHLIAEWEDVTGGAVQTCSEVWESIFGTPGSSCRYNRIPITDEQAPTPASFDSVIEELERTSGPTAIVFNCQMGRGRTTSGMVISCLWAVQKGFQSLDISKKERTSLKERQSLKDQSERPDEHALLRGEYHVIMQLLRVIVDPQTAKSEVDCVIDMCSHMQNLREAILSFKTRAETAISADKHDSIMGVARGYLGRYFYLIAFNAYLREEAPKNFECSFRRWLGGRPEITNILSREIPLH